MQLLLSQLLRGGKLEKKAGATSPEPPAWEEITSLEELEVILLPAVRQQLWAAMYASGHTRTDTVNRFITLGWWWLGILAQGGEHLIRKDGKVWVVKVI
jgi:hypothetical protein